MDESNEYTVVSKNDLSEFSELNILGNDEVSSILTKIHDALSLQVRSLEAVTVGIKTLVDQGSDVEKDNKRKIGFDKLKEKMEFDDDDEEKKGILGMMSNFGSNLKEAIFGEAIGSMLGDLMSSALSFVKLFAMAAVSAPIIHGVLDGMTNGQFTVKMKEFIERISNLLDKLEKWFDWIDNKLGWLGWKNSDDTDNAGFTPIQPMSPENQKDILTTSLTRLFSGGIKGSGKNIVGAFIESQIEGWSGVDLSDTFSRGMLKTLGLPDTVVNKNIADVASSLAVNQLLYKAMTTIATMPFKVTASNMNTALLSGALRTGLGGLTSTVPKVLGVGAGMMGAAPLAAGLIVTPTALGDGTMTAQYANEFEMENPRPKPHEHQSRMDLWEAEKQLYIAKRLNFDNDEPLYSEKDYEEWESIIHRLKLAGYAMRQIQDRYDTSELETEGIMQSYPPSKSVLDVITDLNNEIKNLVSNGIPEDSPIVEELREKIRKLDRYLVLKKTVDYYNDTVEETPQYYDNVPKTTDSPVKMVPSVEEISYRGMERINQIEERATKDGNVSNILMSMMPTINETRGTNVSNVRQGDNIYINSMPEHKQYAYLMGGGPTIKTG